MTLRLPEWFLDLIASALFIVGVVGFIALLHILPDGTEAARQAHHASAAP